MAPIDPDDKKDPAVRVVDRRWWARGEAIEADEASRKPTYIEELEQRLGELTGQMQEMRLDHRRSLEEFEQAKGRIRRDVARDVERGRRVLLTEFLEIIDNLERALAAAKEAAVGDAATGALAQLTRGVELVRDQFVAKLSAFGVNRIAALGQPFDAERHEAVTTTPVSDALQDGLVVSVIRDGYAIGDELLRPASVVVGKLAE